MQIEALSWFPGHMTKTKRMIADEIGHMDAVCEILDARIPLSSRNPDVDEMVGNKPRMVVLNRVDQADPAETKRWAAYFRDKGYAVLESDAKSGMGTAQFAAAVRTLLRDKLAAYEAKGQVGRTLRVMVLGIPNVGKSTFINKVAGRKAAKAEDRPGVTRTKQWIPVDRQLELLDTPGILWPKFEDKQVGIRLAFTGAIKDDVMDIRSWPAASWNTWAAATRRCSGSATGWPRRRGPWAMTFSPRPDAGGAFSCGAARSTPSA